MKLYYTVNTWLKCFAWSGSRTKNVPGPDWIDLVPFRNKTRYSSGMITNIDFTHNVPHAISGLWSSASTS